MLIKKSKLLMLFVCIITVFSAAFGIMPLYSEAASDSKLKIVCANDEKALVGMNWRIYRVGQVTPKGYVLTGDFGRYHADLIDMSEENISAAAQTLESYAIADRKKPIASGVTDENGELVFDNLKSGLYLALGSLFEAAPYYYDPSPLLIEVGENTEYIYNAYPKIERATLSEELMTYTVRKVWLDNNDSFEARPVYITIDIYKDDELFNTVTLNEENNWQYHWESADKLVKWIVVEREIPTDYEVRLEHNEKQYLVRNRHYTVESWKEETVTTTATVSGVTATTYTENVTANVSGSGNNTDGSITTKSSQKTDSSVNQQTSSGGKLPQTGQLWWPIIPLVIGGVILIVLGFMLKPKKEDK